MEIKLGFLGRIKVVEGGGVQAELPSVAPSNSLSLFFSQPMPVLLPPLDSHWKVRSRSS